MELKYLYPFFKKMELKYLAPPFYKVDYQLLNPPKPPKTSLAATGKLNPSF